MTLISRETKRPWMCVPVSEPNKARQRSPAAQSTAGATLEEQGQPGGYLFIAARVINHICWWQVESRAIKVKQRPRCMKRTKVQLRSRNQAIVASNRHSWIVTVVTLEPSIGSFERQMLLNWMSMYCSTQSLTLLDLRSLWVIRAEYFSMPCYCVDDGR